MTRGDRRLAAGGWRLAVGKAAVGGWGLVTGLSLAAVVAGCGGQRMEKVLASGDTVELTIAGKKINAELALDESSRNKGLMYRKSLPEDQGMLFVYPRPQKLQFWMRNTSVPLSIAFIEDEGKILQIEDLRPHDERRVGSKDEVRFALEANRGWFEKNGLKPGSVFDDFRNRISRLDAR